MKKEDITQHIIDQYLLNELTEEDHAAFKDILEDDEALRQDVRFTRMVINGFNREGEKAALEEMNALSPEAFKSIINHAEAKYQQTPHVMAKSGMRRRLFISVTSVAAIALVLIYIGLQPQYSTDSLFEQYYTAMDYEAMPSRSGNNLTEQQEMLLVRAIDSYEYGHYSEALTGFDKIISGLSVENIPVEIQFYSSLCNIEVGQTALAIEKLSHLISFDNIYSEDAQWYLVLAYIKLNKKDEALVMLARIGQNSEHRYSSQAKELLKKLEEKRWF